MFRPFVAALLLAAPVPLLAQEAAGDGGSTQAETGQPPQRIRSVTLTGNESCPKASGDEIVVCSRLNANEQYRVPKALRQPPEVPAENRAWGSRAATVDQVSRVAGGLPNTCSPVGNGGQTGCFSAYGQNYALEKKERKKEEAAATATSDDSAPQE